MLVTLTSEDIDRLVQHLTQRIAYIDGELVHTDKRDLQRALAEELQALHVLTDKIRCAKRDEEAGGAAFGVQ
jgi:hypothetical protein